MPNCIRERLKETNHTQAWLVQKLAEEGVYTNPGELSYILSDVLNSPKAVRVIDKCNDILEKEADNVDTRHG